MSPIKRKFSEVLHEWVEVFMHRSMRDSMLFWKESGLSFPQISTLMRLHYRGACGVSDVGGHLGVTLPAASQMVDKLAQQGLLERAEDPHDRRAKQLTLTTKGTAVLVGAKGEGGALHAERVALLEKEILARLAEFHAKEPLKDGLAKEELRSKLPPQLMSATFGWMLTRLTEGKRIAVERDKVRLATHRPTLSAAEEELKAKIEAAYRGAGFQPSTPDGVFASLQADRKLAHAVFRRMVDDAVVVKIKEEIFLHRERYQELRERVLAHFGTQPRINVGAMKDLFGVSRKYAIPFLEHLDDVRITRRQGDERVPYK